MLVNIGQDKMITDSEIIGIFDLDNTTVSKATAKAYAKNTYFCKSRKGGNC